MPPKIDATPIIREAFEALEHQTGLKTLIRHANKADVNEMATIKWGPKPWHFRIEVKPWLNRATLALLKEKDHNGEKRRILVTRQVTLDQADQLRDMNLAFVDTAGNACFRLPGLFVFMKGQKLAEAGERGMLTFNRPAELRVLFALLCDPGLVARTHEEIRQVTGVGIATINRLIHALEKGAFLLKVKGQARRLIRKRELLDNWVIAYPQRLRPKCFIGRFVGPRDEWWTRVDPTEYDAQWGGEVAADLLTQYLKPEFVTIYTARQPNEFILRQKLRKDDRGTIEILKRFWNLHEVGPITNTIPALLVYADLLATAEARNIETARMIYDQYLAGIIEER
jgi:hypothetical protein